MDTTIVKPYVDALGAQRTKLEGFLSRGVQAIAIPANYDEMNSRHKDFLTESGVWFLVLGAIALVAGLFMKETGIIVAGCAALLSGGYVYIKGKQAMRAEAFANLGSNILAQIKNLADNVSADWTSFMIKQNDSLKQQVVTDSDSAADKVAMIDKIDSTPAIKVDLSGVETTISEASTHESLPLYRDALPQAQRAISTAIDTAGGAQQTIYSAISK